MREVTKIFTAICVKQEFFKNQKEEDIESEKFLLYMGQYFKLSLDKMDDMSLAHLLAVLAGKREDTQLGLPDEPVNSLQAMLTEKLQDEDEEHQ